MLSGSKEETLLSTVILMFINTNRLMHMLWQSQSQMSSDALGDSHGYAVVIQIKEEEDEMSSYLCMNFFWSSFIQ